MVTCPGSCTTKGLAAPLGTLPLGAASETAICVNLTDDSTQDVTHCDECQVGLTCYKSACRVDWQLGEACSDASGCWPKLWCDTVQGKCIARAGAGESCDRSGFKAPFCVDGYFCSGPNLTIGTCLPKSPAGAPCIDQYDCLDPHHTRCIPAEDPSALGSCGPPAGVGSPCKLPEDCTSHFCAADMHCQEPTVGASCINDCGRAFACVDKLCVTKRYDGDACGASDLCEASRCEAGKCALRARLGQSCAADDDCISNRCTSGACADGAECAP